MTEAETWHKPEDCLHITPLESVCADGHLWCAACDFTCPACGERPDWRPRRDYLEAVVTAYTTVSGHANPARANACTGSTVCSVDDLLTVGEAAVSCADASFEKTIKRLIRENKEQLDKLAEESTQNGDTE